MAVVLLTGCVTVSRPSVEVSSPPPPRVGSAPIVAQDAYARVMFGLPTDKDNVLVSLVWNPSGPVLPLKAKGPVPATKSRLN